MPRLLTRLLINLLCVPLAVLLYVLSVILLEAGIKAFFPSKSWSERQIIEMYALVVQFYLNGSVVMLVQWLIWRPVVAWTSRRKARTIAVWVATPVVTILQTAAWITCFQSDQDFAVRASVVSTVVVTALALITNYALWTETPRERAKRTAVAGLNRTTCPLCRYDLSGLTNLRCPECGHEFTFGALIEENRRRETPQVFDG